MMMLRWTPPHDRHLYRGLKPGDMVPGPLDAHPAHLHAWLVEVEAGGFSDPGLSAPAPEAKPAPIFTPAPDVQVDRPDLSGLHWRRVASLSDGLGYDADDRSKGARLAWLDTLPADVVAAALAALED